MTANRNPIPMPLALLILLTSLIFSGCAPAVFTHQRVSTRTDASLDEAAVAPRPDPWRPAIPAFSQASLAGPPVVLNDPRESYRETYRETYRGDESPAALIMRDAAADRTTDTARPTVLRASTSSFDQHVLAADVPVLVDFYADWCGPCRTLSPTLDQVAAENPQVRVVKVNIDDSPELAARYGVRSVPRLLVFKNGQIAAQQNGVASKTRLYAMLGLSEPVSLE